MKPVYPIYHLDIVVAIVVKAKFGAFFSIDIVNRY
jgi:hypothetical protein